MNNGDDSAYYLAKGLRVVAIEADPALCAAAGDRFAAPIAEGRLRILNIGVGPAPGCLTFYRHAHSVLSTFVPPAQRVGHAALLREAAFQTLPIEVRRLSDVVTAHGPPHYIKIDVEGFDTACLNDLNLHGIRPAYISAEAHTLETFCHLVVMGYRDFKMVAGQTVAEDFACHRIRTNDGALRDFAFQPHSAGPFGEDIPGDWLDADAMVRRWLARGDGWFDLHARAVPGGMPQDGLSAHRRYTLWLGACSRSRSRGHLPGMALE